MYSFPPVVTTNVSKQWQMSPWEQKCPELRTTTRWCPNLHLHGLPWSSSGYKSACQRRGHGFDPWSGKTPPAVGQLSLCPTTTEPVPWSPCSATRETTAMRSLHTTAWKHPHLPQPEKPACSIKDPVHTSQKNQDNKKPWHSIQLKWTPINLTTQTTKSSNQNNSKSLNISRDNPINT